MKKELERYEKGIKHFKAVVGTIVEKTNYYGLKEEVLSLEAVCFMSGRETPIADRVWINKTQGTELLFDIARQGLTNQSVSFYGIILEYNENVQMYDGINLLQKEVHCKIGYIKNAIIHFK